MKNSTALFSGAGIGALLGLLIGMSVSGTVGVVVGALTSVVLVLLGLKENTDSTQQALRIGAFGISCAACALLGVYIRVNNVFAPALSEEINKWTEDGQYSLTDAQQFVAYQRLGILPKDFKVDKSRKTDSGTGVLYSSEGTVTECKRAGEYESFTIDEQIGGWKRLGGVWKEAAEAVERNIDLPERKEVLSIVRNCLCHDNK